MDVYSHPCGEYVYEQLRSGVPADRVCEVLRQEYLVSTNPSLLRAYRRFREQKAGYWTLEQLELHHWRWLYAEALRWSKLQCFKPEDARLQDVRRRFCESIEVAEELVPLAVLRAFFDKHAEHARLALYPGTSLFTDSLPLQVVEAYSQVLRGRTLPALASRCAAMFGACIAVHVPLPI